MKFRHLISASLAALALWACDQSMAPQAGTNDEVTTSLQLLSDNMRILNAAAGVAAAAREAGGDTVVAEDSMFSVRYTQHEGWESILEVKQFDSLGTNGIQGFAQVTRAKVFQLDSIASVERLIFESNWCNNHDSSGDFTGDNNCLYEGGHTDEYSTTTMRTGFVFRRRPMDSTEIRSFQSLQGEAKSRIGGVETDFLVQYPGDLVVPRYGGQTRRSDGKYPIFRANRIVGYAAMFKTGIDYLLTEITDLDGSLIAPNNEALGPLPEDSLGVRILGWSIDSSTLPMSLVIDASWRFTDMTREILEHMDSSAPRLSYQFQLWDAAGDSRGDLPTKGLSWSGQHRFRVALDSSWTTASLKARPRLQLSLHASDSTDSTHPSVIESYSLWQPPSAPSPR